MWKVPVHSIFVPPSAKAVSITLLVAMQHAVEDDVAEFCIWDELNDLLLVHLLTCRNSTNVANPVRIMKRRHIPMSTLSLYGVDPRPDRPRWPINE